MLKKIISLFIKNNKEEEIVKLGAKAFLICAEWDKTHEKIVSKNIR